MNKHLITILIVVVLALAAGGYFFFYSSPDTYPVREEEILTDESGDPEEEKEEYGEEEIEIYASIPWHHYTLQELIYCNYTGTIHGETVDVYIIPDTYSEELTGSVVVYHPDRSMSGYGFSLSGEEEDTPGTYGISIRTRKGEDVFYGTLSPECLEGGWIGNELYEDISLRRAPLSVTIESYISEERERILRIENNRKEFNAGLVNRKIYTHISELFGRTEPGCDSRGTNFEIHCNQQGILSLTVYSYEDCGGHKGTMWERFLVYDLLTGEQLTPRKIFTRNYERILEQMGYDVQGMDIFIFPNGITFTGHFSNWGPGEMIFFTWEEILPVLKPESPLTPFLRRSKIIPKQTKKAPAIPAKRYSRINDPFNGIRVVKLNGKYGYIDDAGKEITPIQYDYAEDFFDTVAFIQVGDKYGLVNMAGEEITPIKYTSLPIFWSGVAIVTDGKHYGVINRKGEEITSLKYSWIDSFQEGYAVVTKRYDSDYSAKGYIDLSGNEITPTQYITAKRFKEGMALVELMKGRYTFIDTTGKNIPRSYDYASEFCNGFAIVKNSIGYGFINKAGDEITRLTYDRCEDFDEYGYGRVKSGGYWGYIDTTGVEVINPTYKYVYSFDQDRLAYVVLTDDRDVFIDKCENVYETRQEYYNLQSTCLGTD